MTKELTCVVCPAGCRMTAELDESGKVISVTGNTCPRGKTYAESEITNPVRTLTTTVTITGAADKAVMLPVKTSKSVWRARCVLWHRSRPLSSVTSFTI
jgi:CxxC motif-containing protein